MRAFVRLQAADRAEVADLLRAVTDPLCDQQFLRRLTVGHGVDLDRVGALAGDRHDGRRAAGHRGARRHLHRTVRRIRVDIPRLLDGREPAAAFFEHRVHLFHVFRRARALCRLDLLPADRALEFPQALAQCGQIVGKDGTAGKRGHEENGYRGDEPPLAGPVRSGSWVHDHIPPFW